MGSGREVLVTDGNTSFTECTTGQWDGWPKSSFRGTAFSYAGGEKRGSGVGGTCLYSLTSIKDGDNCEHQLLTRNQKEGGGVIKRDRTVGDH